MFAQDLCGSHSGQNNSFFPLPFVVNAHVGFFDEKRARYLADANCSIVKFGVESGSENIRRLILQRRMKNEKIISAIKTAHQYGLHTSIFLMIGLPDETRADVMATIRLMARAKPGRYRWSFFFPFPGTKAYALSEQGNYIDFAKMAQMKNFTDGSCLNFGKEHNLFLKKVGRIMPWFVNAAAILNLAVADFYRKKELQRSWHWTRNPGRKEPSTSSRKTKIFPKDLSSRALATMRSNTTALWASYQIISRPKIRNDFSILLYSAPECRASFSAAKFRNR